MIEVDVPRPGAKFDRKMIWYMPYFVRYVLPPKKDKEKEKAKEEGGEAAKAEGGEPAKAEAEPAADPKLPPAVKFLPRFMLFSDQKTKTADGREVKKVYMDRVIPVAMDPIGLRGSSPQDAQQRGNRREADPTQHRHGR